MDVQFPDIVECALKFIKVHSFAAPERRNE